MWVLWREFVVTVMNVISLTAVLTVDCSEKAQHLQALAVIGAITKVE
jgi:hypothetical protein